MKLEDITDLYELISVGIKNIPNREKSINVRSKLLNNLNSGFNKLAFDTRRINQETDYNPRRGLQNYHRSQPFISETIAKKVKAFSKLSGILDQLKEQYGREPEWQDSYTRILNSAVKKGLKNNETGGDFSDAQPSMASLDYLEELMDVRYRLSPENLISMNENQLREAILKKDEFLVKSNLILKDPEKIPVVTPTDVSKFSYDMMVDRMLTSMSQAMNQMKVPDSLTDKLFNVQATSENPDVERTITITIKDKLNDTKSLKKSGNEYLEGVKIDIGE